MLCDRQPFAAALHKALSITPRSTPKEVLKYVLLSTVDGKVVMRSSNGDIHASIPACDADGELKPCLVNERLLAAVKDAPDDTLKIEQPDNGKIRVKCGGTFTLQHPEADLFPVMGGGEAKYRCRIGQSDLAAGFAATRKLIDVAATHYAMGGILFEPVGDFMNLAATDSRRLASFRIPVDGSGESLRPVLPAPAVQLAVAMESDVSLSLSASTATFEADNGAVIVTQILQGRFPKYETVIPQKWECELRSTVGVLASAIRRANTTSDVESRAMCFTVANGTLSLSAKAADVGESEVSIPVDSSDEFEFWLTPSFALDAISWAAPEDVAVIRFVGPEAAVWIGPDDSRVQSVVMPMTGR